MGESAAVSLYCKPFFLLCCSAVMLLLTDVRRRLFDKYLYLLQYLLLQYAVSKRPFV
jgi:hypothetical protein